MKYPPISNLRHEDQLCLIGLRSLASLNVKEKSLHHLFTLEMSEKGVKQCPFSLIAECVWDREKRTKAAGLGRGEHKKEM